MFQCWRGSLWCWHLLSKTNYFNNQFIKSIILNFLVTSMQVSFEKVAPPKNKNMSLFWPNKWLNLGKNKSRKFYLCIVHSSGRLYLSFQRWKFLTSPEFNIMVVFSLKKTARHIKVLYISDGSCTELTFASSYYICSWLSIHFQINDV